MKPQQGFTAVELMVAMALSLVLIGGAVTIFYSTKLSYQATDETARIQETGRLALELMLRDIRNSGWQGCSREVPVNNVLIGATETLWNFAEPVGGFDVGSSVSSTWAPALPNATVPELAAVPPLAGNDVLVVRGPRRDARPLRTVTEMTNGTQAVEAEFFNNPAPIVAGNIVQIADCSAISWFQADDYTAAGEITRSTGTAAGTNATADLGFAFREAAELVPVETVIYYIGQGETGGPSLYRIAGAGAAVEVFEGVEGLQVLYGVDDTGDFRVDAYRDADAVAGPPSEWANVLAVNIALLVRGPDEQGVNVDDRVYNLLGVDYPDTGTGFGDRRRREIYTATATLRNRVQ